jgi:Xaa-Pro aminopeptidase
VEFTLRPGCTVTVEPGLYFHPALLQDPNRRRRYGDRVDWDRALDLVALGGVRIEDNVHVTGDGPEVLTAAIPKRL